MGGESTSFRAPLFLSASFDGKGYFRGGLPTIKMFRHQTKKKKIKRFVRNLQISECFDHLFNDADVDDHSSTINIEIMYKNI